VRAWAAALMLLGGCASSGDDVVVVHESAEAHGRALFDDRRAGSVVANAFSCSTCHPGGARVPTAGRIYPGPSLAGATARTRYWGGMRLDLLEAINDCRTAFMDAPAPWVPEQQEAQAMFAYLSSLPGEPAPVPFTVALGAPDVPAGDAVAGASLFQRACGPCHGQVHSGQGKVASFLPRLPDDVNASHAQLAPKDRRLVFLHKVREGGFGGAPGTMPPFSREVLSDGDLSAILAFLGQQ